MSTFQPHIDANSEFIKYLKIIHAIFLKQNSSFLTYASFTKCPQRTEPPCLFLCKATLIFYMLYISIITVFETCKIEDYFLQ